MAKSARAVVVSWCAAAAVALSAVAPDAASAARFSFGGGFAHGVRPGGGFGFRPGLSGSRQNGFFPGGPQSVSGCGFAPSRCGGDGTDQGPHRGGFGHGPHWGGFGPGPEVGGADDPDGPPDDPGYDGPDAGPAVAAAAQASESHAALAGGERLVREFSETARLALGRCRAVAWPANEAPLGEAEAKRLRCVGDVLAVYAEKLEDAAPILPGKMRSIPVVLKATAKKVRAAKTRAEAASAIATATAEVHKAIALLKADDPVVRSIATREAGQISQTLDLAGDKLEKAAGL